MTRASKVRKIIGGVLLAMCVLFLILTLATGEDPKKLIPFFAIYGIIALVLILWPTRKKTLSGTSNTGAISASDDKIKEFTTWHVSGLPLPEKVPCQLIFLNNKLKLTNKNTNVELVYKKIINMQILTDAEIQKQYVSSISGAIGGAMLLGPIGAMIGGRAKEKKSTNFKFYLIIAYKGDQGLQYINLEVLSTAGIGSVIKKIKPYFSQEQQTISL